jgi:hypothetical protein
MGGAPGWGLRLEAVGCAAPVAQMVRKVPLVAPMAVTLRERPVAVAGMPVQLPLSPWASMVRVSPAPIGVARADVVGCGSGVGEAAGGDGDERDRAGWAGGVGGGESAGAECDGDGGADRRPSGAKHAGVHVSPPRSTDGRSVTDRLRVMFGISSGGRLRPRSPAQTVAQDHRLDRPDQLRHEPARLGDDRVVGAVDAERLGPGIHSNSRT